MKKILFVMLILLASLVAAAPLLTNLSLQGNAGTTVQGTVTLSGLENDPLITLESTNLVAGSNTLSNSNIIITELNSANTSMREYTVRVNIPDNQPSGTYVGTLRASEGNTLIAQSTLTVIVNSNITSGASFSMNDISLGSDDQEREVTINGNLRVSNTGTDTLTISLTHNVPSAYQFTLSQNTVTLTSGQSIDVPVTVYVPDTQDSGRISIGTVTAISEDGGTRIATAYLETKSELEISKVKIEVDGDTESISDDDEVDAKAGDDVILTVTVRNNFNDNIDIEDVEVEVESDDDLDWDDTNDVGDISDDDKEDVEFSFSIDNDIDEDEYDVEVRVSGEDENGATHEDTLTFTVNIDKENHEITIRSATLSPNRVSCDARTVTVRTNVENTGSNDENDVSIVVENEELNIYEYATKIDLDEDDDTDKSFVFTVPKNVQTGEYIIHVTTYYDNDEESDEKVLSLFVDACSGTTTTNTTTTGTGGTSGSGTGTIQPIVYPSGTVGPTYGGVSFFNSAAYVVLLVVAVLIFLVMITLLLVKFVF